MLRQEQPAGAMFPVPQQSARDAEEQNEGRPQEGRGPESTALPSHRSAHRREHASALTLPRFLEGRGAQNSQIHWPYIVK